jgi:hypothetical protein
MMADDDLDAKIAVLEAETGLDLSGDEALDASLPSEVADHLAGSAAPPVADSPRAESAAGTIREYLDERDRRIDLERRVREAEARLSQQPTSATSACPKRRGGRTRREGPPRAGRAAQEGRQVNPSFRCDYHSGMFANEPRGQEHAFDAFFEAEAARFHEAGHAVVGYALGLGCSSVGVFVDCRYQNDGSLGYGFGGVALVAKTNQRRFLSAANRGSIPHLLALGIQICAGPAAERRFRIKMELPLAMLGATVGDHRQVDDGLAKILGARRFAFLRAAWARAQKAIECDPIWSSIAEVAGALELPEWPEGPGVEKIELPGSLVRSIARRHGVRPSQ